MCNLFSGEVRGGREFRRALDTGLEFVLKPGWAIAIVSTKPEGDCQEFTDVVNPPYRDRKDKYDEALAKLGTSARGTGRLWITNIKIGRSGGTLDGRIEWMTFTVEIILPHQ